MPRVRGLVALRWDIDCRAYAAVAGWMPELNGAATPTDVGKAFKEYGEEYRR